MEDRYLYKAKRVDNGEWVEGFMVACDERIFIAQKPECNTSMHMLDGYWMGTYIEIDPSTLCQCTGLKDKDGKLIWENDIVGYVDMYSTESGYAEMNCAGEVLWDKETMSFQVTNRLSVESYEVLQECLILGNIFDNPELLEV